VSDRPSGAGAAAAAAAGEWPLAGDGAAGCAVADADADTARSVSPSRGRGPPWARHGGPPGRTRAPHLRQSARRWRRARRLVEWHAVVARVRAPPRRVWRRCYPSPLPPRPLILPPPPPLPAAREAMNRFQGRPWRCHRHRLHRGCWHSRTAETAARGTAPDASGGGRFF